MRRAVLCSLLAFLGGTATANLFPGGLSSSASNFAAVDYDYVIIGGGTAGLVVAARLSEDPKLSVGVIEAGQYLVDDPLIDVPQNAYALQGNPKYDWLLKTTPQPNLKNRVMNLPRGKLLGGSSGINIMAFDRASTAEYDGSPGWGWNELLPFMKRAERFTSTDPFRVNSTDPNPNVIYPSQGTNGPVAGSYNEWYSDVTAPYGKAMVNAGVPANYDPDSGNAYGHFNSATSINRTTGKRSYAASTYYAYNAARPNLVVLTGAQVTKINFANATDKFGKITASGVSFVSNSTTFSVRARKEVILSAGSLKSPQLLELSGIGNATILKQFGIKPLVDLPGVGENLQDHPMISATYELKPGKTTLDILRNNATYAAQAQAQYASTHDGIYATTVSIMSFVNLKTFISQKKLASMMAQLDKETATGTSSLQRAQYAIQRKWLAQKLGHIEIVFYPGYYGTGVAKANTSYVAMLMVLQHPFSRGNVHINTSDLLAPAVFNPNYFSKSFDPASLVEALKFSLTVSKTEPLASSIVARQDPTPNVTSDADILDYARNIARTLHHPIGTVALAPRALGGVVDPNLKVYGTENLRVVDASIIPLHMGTHLQRSVYGIGEKASAMIKSGR